MGSTKIILFELILPIVKYRTKYHIVICFICNVTHVNQYLEYL